MALFYTWSQFIHFTQQSPHNIDAYQKQPLRQSELVPIAMQQNISSLKQQAFIIFSNFWESRIQKHFGCVILG